MKTIKYISGFAVVALLLGFIACDKIKDEDRLIDQGVEVIVSERCVLLEDYTGVRCVNCPAAAEEIKKLQAAYGKNLVVVEMHPNDLWMTMPIDNDPDLRTKEAKTYADFFNTINLPQGLVNRKEALGYQSWAGAIQEVIDDTASDYVNLAASAQLSGSSIKVSINGNLKKDYPADGDINVLAMVVEDNIVTQQEGQGQHIKEYVHNHVFRSVVSDDVWGDKILDAQPSEGEEFTKQYTATLDEAWKTQDLALVVVVVNAKSREVLQATYTHVK